MDAQFRQNKTQCLFYYMLYCVYYILSLDFPRLSSDVNVGKLEVVGGGASESKARNSTVVENLFTVRINTGTVHPSRYPTTSPFPDVFLDSEKAYPCFFRPVNGQSKGNGSTSNNAYMTCIRHVNHIVSV